jgi:hypothetical protein
MKVNANTKRHGRSAVIAMLEQAVWRDADTTSPTAQFEEVLDAYLTAYAGAPEQAKRGFRDLLSDLLSEGYRGIKIDPADFYTLRQFHGGRPGPRRPERKAHARVWLKGGEA